ncbi:MAG: peptide ABC transporter substrate-binding protein [Chloroflexota bacterium]
MNQQVGVPTTVVRREFLRRSLSAAAVGPMVALLAACGGTTAVTATTAAGSPATSSGAGSTNAATGSSAAATAASGTVTKDTKVAATTAATSSGTAATTTTARSAGAAATTSSSAAAAAATGARGKGGTLKMLFWQGIVILNPHLANGTKDDYGSRLVLEPLLTASIDGTLAPVLAAEVPTLQNGMLAADGKSVTFKLKPNVVWSDGEPFTADDVVFTWQYVTDKATAALTSGTFAPLESVTAVDPLTVKATFKDPNPAWFAPFLGYNGVVLPKHILQSFVGANARNAPFNQKPIGTGPYKVDSFASGDLVVYSMNDKYRDPNKPTFSQVQIKGGGDAVSAARAVFQTGEYDYAWNLQVEWPVLQGIIAGGKGDLVTSVGGGCEQLFFNLSDPNKDVNGEKSHLGTPSPTLGDPKVRQAICMALDRTTMAKNLYGDTGDPTIDILTTPTSFKSSGVTIPYDIAKANQLLDDAGWKKGSDGIRAKGGVPLKLVFQTSINSLRQKEQAIIKQGCQQIGIDLTLKTVDASVFFSSDAGNPDTDEHFYADLEMFTSTVPNPAPVSYMRRWSSVDPAVDIAQKSNQWSGSNYERWQNDDFNTAYKAAVTEIDPQKLAVLMQKMNDLVVSNYVTVGLIDRKNVDCKAKTLNGPNVGVFDANVWNIADWTRQA